MTNAEVTAERFANAVFLNTHCNWAYDPSCMLLLYKEKNTNQKMMQRQTEHWSFQDSKRP